MAIEIDSNTILKLIIRNGSNEERKGIILAEGELGYTVDTKRLFVGDGVTPGGISVANRFIGSTLNILDPALNPTVNDLVFKSDTNEIYRLQSGDGTNLSDWQLIAGPTLNVVDNQTISANNSTGELFVNLISGGNLDDSVFGTNIVKSGGAINLSNSPTVDSISTDAVTLNAEPYLTMPNNIEFDNGSTTQRYVFPVGTSLNTGWHLTTDSQGNLLWSPPDRIVEGTTYINTAATPVGTISPYITLTPKSSAIAMAGWLYCDGSILAGTEYPELSAVIGDTFGGDGIATFALPDLNNSTTYGIDPTVGIIGNTFVPLTTAATLSSDALSALNVYYIIKYRLDAAFEDNVLEMNVQTLTSQGVSGFNITSGDSVSSVGPSGQFSISIPPGDIGTGNERVVEAVQRARVPSMTALDTPGTFAYTVPDNVYRIKVTATGAGGIGYLLFDGPNWRGNGTNGGAGGSVIAYVDVEPGQVYKATIGSKGVTSNNTTFGSDLGTGDNTTFGLSTVGTVYDDIIAEGAYDGFVRDGITRGIKWNDSKNPGTARGGFMGGNYTVNNSSGKIVSYVGMRGGNGGNYHEAGPESVGGSGIWGSGPAPGGGGSGSSTIDAAQKSSAEAGDGLIIVEEL